LSVTLQQRLAWRKVIASALQRQKLLPKASVNSQVPPLKKMVLLFSYRLTKGIGNQPHTSEYKLCLIVWHPDPDCKNKMVDHQTGAEVL
jgi:hypothetical protein